MEYLHFYISAALLIFCGYMIYFKDKAEWIAGYNEGKESDRKRLTLVVGISAIIMGGLYLLAPVAMLAFPILQGWNGHLFLLITIAGTLSMLVGSQK